MSDKEASDKESDKEVDNVEVKENKEEEEEDSKVSSEEEKNENEEDENEEDESEDAQGVDFRKLSEREKARAIRKLYLETAAEDEDEPDASDSDEPEEDEQGVYKRAKMMQDLAAEDSTLHRALDEEREQQEAASLHARIESKFGQAGEEMDRRIEERGVRIPGRVREVPQEHLLPTVQDPKLWAVRCDPTHENELIILLMRKYMFTHKSDEPMFINSAFSAPHTQGYVYIEADKKVHVEQAVRGIRMIKGWNVRLVPIQEMVQSLEVNVNTKVVKKNDWARFKRGIFASDLCQVHRTKDQGTTVTVKLLPRIDYAALEERQNRKGAAKRKRSKGIRPPQRPFDENEVRALGGDVVRDSRGDFFKFQSNYFKNGFLYKTCKSNLLDFDRIVPTAEELEKFSAELTPELQASAMSKVGISKDHTYRKGDRVIVTEGDLAKLTGRVVTMPDKNTVLIDPDVKDLTELLPFPISEVKKFFKVGDHAKVIAGQHKNETGLIIRVDEKTDMAVLLSDISNSQLDVATHDMYESSEYATGSESLGEYSLYDLVTLDQNSVGCIIKVDLNSFQVLDTNGTVRSINLKEMGRKWISRNSATIDKNNNQITTGDVVRMLDGPSRGIQGTVKHIFRSFVFVHSRKTDRNNGILLTRSRNLLLVGQPSSSSSMGGMSPRTNSNAAGEGGRRPAPARFNGRFNNDPMLNQSVTITGGPYKGYLGIVRSADMASYNVELHAIRKEVSVPTNKVILATSSRPAQEPEKDVFLGSRTPAHQASGSQTPHHHDGGMTPMTPFASSGYSTSAPSQTPSQDIWNPTTPHRPNSPSSMDVTDDNNVDPWQKMMDMDPTASYSPSHMAVSDDEEEQKYVPGCLVIVGGQEGPLIDSTTSGWNVKLPSGIMDVPTKRFNIVMPKTNDKVIIFEGMHKGKVGVLLGTDMAEDGVTEECLIEMPGSSDMEIAPLTAVAKYEDPQA